MPGFEKTPPARSEASRHHEVGAHAELVWFAWTASFRKGCVPKRDSENGRSPIAINHVMPMHTVYSNNL